MLKIMKLVLMYINCQTGYPVGLDDDELIINTEEAEAYIEDKEDRGPASRVPSIARKRPLTQSHSILPKSNTVSQYFTKSTPISPNCHNKLNKRIPHYSHQFHKYYRPQSWAWATHHCQPMSSPTIAVTNFSQYRHPKAWPSHQQSWAPLLFKALKR